MPKKQKRTEAEVHAMIVRDAKIRVSGDSPPFYKVGRQVLYDRADLDAWLAERRRRSTSDPGHKDG